MINRKIWFFAFCLGILTLVSCSSQKGMRIQVLRPAHITVPKEIKSLAIVNRSIPSNIATIEGTLSGEKPVTDKDLSEECIRGLAEILLTSERFKITRVDTTIQSSDPKSLSFGSPMPWNDINNLCQRLNVDGLLVLEFFDTDFTLDNPIGAANQVIQGALQGGNREISVTGTAKATAGFRVYYNKEKTIAYEDRFYFKRRWTERSMSAQEAISKMIRKSAALIQVSNETGKEFAFSIVPLYVWENRVLLKGKGMLKVGERQALSKDWEGALQSWMRVYENSIKRKERAKAAHNIAFAYEVLGDLKTAQNYASKAYVEGGKKASLEYSSILDKLIRQQDKIKEQMKNFE
jgi:hypothetical protein